MASPPPPPPLPDALGASVIDFVSSSPPPETVATHSSSSLKNLSPSILIILTILAFTAFASVILCLVLRYLNRRCLLRLSAVPGSSSSSLVSSRRITPAEQSTARCANSFSPIDSLPLFSFSSITRRSSTTAAADCAVCLSKFEAEDQLRLLPLCCHAFHAQCVDTWLQSNQSCPLCRSAIFASESDVIKASMASYAAEGRGGDSFRLEIGSISRRQGASDSGDGRRSYSIGSFEYFVEEDSEVNFTNAHRRSVSDKDQDIEAPSERSLAAEVGSGRNWLKDYVDRLSNSVSSRALSFRGSGRFFTGSSRRSEVVVGGDWEQESSRVGEEISEMFRWFSGV